MVRQSWVASRQSPRARCPAGFRLPTQLCYDNFPGKKDSFAAMSWDPNTCNLLYTLLIRRKAIYQQCVCRLFGNSISLSSHTGNYTAIQSSLQLRLLRLPTAPQTEGMFVSWFSICHVAHSRGLQELMCNVVIFHFSRMVFVTYSSRASERSQVP